MPGGREIPEQDQILRLEYVPGIGDAQDWNLAPSFVLMTQI